jgi:hypothetical protein
VVFFEVKSLRSALERNGFRVVQTVFSAYDPARNNQARGAFAWGVRALEAAGAVLFGQFRLLMLGRKQPPALGS